MQEKKEQCLARKPPLDDLDLVPVYGDEDRTDLGLPSADILATSRVLARLLRLDRPGDAVVAALIGEIKPGLELQLGHALQREEHEAVANEGRRKLLVRAAQGLIGLTGIGIAGKLVFDSALSPETVAKRAEEERRKKELFERNSTLGLDPSSFSDKDWRVKYLHWDNGDNGVSYEDSVLSIVSAGAYINFQPDILRLHKDTGIVVQEYTRSDGTSVPMLSILLPNNSWESWILRDSPTSEIDNRAVVFENVKTGEIHYLSIKKTKAAGSVSFQIDKLQRIENK